MPLIEGLRLEAPAGLQLPGRDPIAEPTVIRFEYISDEVLEKAGLIGQDTTQHLSPVFKSQIIDRPWLDVVRSNQQKPDGLFLAATNEDGTCFLGMCRVREEADARTPWPHCDKGWIAMHPAARDQRVSKWLRLARQHVLFDRPELNSFTEEPLALFTSIRKENDASLSGAANDGAEFIGAYDTIELTDGKEEKVTRHAFVTPHPRKLEAYKRAAVKAGVIDLRARDATGLTFEERLHRRAKQNQELLDIASAIIHFT
ncbi:MAG TPA: hypothetical protein VLG16_00460 [Candidatus Saccharimonadales bacterium]|nr:hypothetical protein [Candidatus Saccharimonadales bacterium]